MPSVPIGQGDGRAVGWLIQKQLHTLRTCYSANSRPDALMKEQLVEMTGLSPRVIRVWFQNKRCKDKKRSLALKQLHQRQHGKVQMPAAVLEPRPLPQSPAVTCSQRIVTKFFDLLLLFGIASQEGTPKLLPGGISPHPPIHGSV